MLCEYVLARRLFKAGGTLCGITKERARPRACVFAWDGEWMECGRVGVWLPERC